MKEKSGVSRPVIRSIAWVGAGSGVQIGVKLVVLMILARLLTPTEFGVVAIVVMVLSFSQFLARFGVAPAVVQSLKLTDSAERGAFFASILISSTISIALIIASPHVAVFFNIDNLNQYLTLIAFVPFVAGVSQISEALLQREVRFKELTLIDGAGHIFGYGLFSLMLAVLGLGVWSILVGILAQEVIRSLLLLVKRRPKIGLSFTLRDITKLIRFGFGMSAVQITNVLAYQADNLVVAKMMGAESLGFYSRAYQVVTLPTKILGNSLLKVLFPVLSTLQNDHGRLSEAFIRAWRLIATVCISTTVFVVALADEIVMLLLGPQWTEVVIPLKILSVAIIFRVGHKLCDSVIRSLGHVYSLWVRQAFYASAVLSFAYLGHYFGLPGVAWGVVLAVALNFFMLLWMVKVKVDMEILRWLISSAPAFLFGGLAWVVSASLAPQLRSAGLHYAAVLGLSAFSVAFAVILVVWMFPSVIKNEHRIVIKSLKAKVSRNK